MSLWKSKGRKEQEATRLGEIMKRLYAEAQQKHLEAFADALEDFVRELNACDETNTLMVLRNTQRDILTILGYAPHTTICGVCGATPKDESTSFSVELGSIVCTSCTRSGWHGTVLADDDRRWLASERATAPCTTRAVRAPTEQLMEFISGRRLRSLDLLFEAVQT